MSGLAMQTIWDLFTWPNLRHLSKSETKAYNRVNGALILRANYSLSSIHSSLEAAGVQWQL